MALSRNMKTPRPVGRPPKPVPHVVARYRLVVYLDQPQAEWLGNAADYYVTSRTEIMRQIVKSAMSKSRIGQHVSDGSR